MCLCIESFHVFTLLFRTVERPFKRIKAALVRIVTDNFQEIIKKRCEFAQYCANFEYVIMSKEIVLKSKGESYGRKTILGTGCNLVRDYCVAWATQTRP